MCGDERNEPAFTRDVDGIETDNLVRTLDVIANANGLLVELTLRTGPGSDRAGGRLRFAGFPRYARRLGT